MFLKPSDKPARVPLHHCPGCGAKLSAVEGMDHDAPPVPGSPTFCLMCGELLVLDEHLMARRPTARELLELQLSAEWPEIQAMGELLKQFRASSYFTGAQRKQKRS